MTLTLDMTPELEQRLREEAARRGVAAEEYVRGMLEEQLLRAPHPMRPGKSGPEERKQRLRQWIEDNRGLPVLTEIALRRASFYGDRD